jgi:hypothetical protein
LNQHKTMVWWSYIYNQSLYTSIFPDCLKSAVLKPLCKKGDENSMTKLQAYIIINMFC